MPGTIPVRRDKTMKCGPKTEQCGKRCIPKGQNCSHKRTKGRRRLGVVAGVAGTVAGLTAANVAQTAATMKESEKTGLHLGKQMAMNAQKKKRRDSFHDDDILFRADGSGREDKRMNCKAGNKQCGDRCIPRDQNCDKSRPKKGTFRKGVVKGAVGTLATIGAMRVAGDQVQHAQLRNAIKEQRRGDSEMFNAYDNDILIDTSSRFDAKRLKCSPGNKQCGSRCIPADQDCSKGKAKKTSKRSNVGRNSLAAGIASAALGGGVLVSVKGAKNRQAAPPPPVSAPQRTPFKNTMGGKAAAVGVGLGAAGVATAAGRYVNNRAKKKEANRQAARASEAAARRAQEARFKNGETVRMVDDGQTIRARGGDIKKGSSTGGVVSSRSRSSNPPGPAGALPSTGKIAKAKGSNITPQPSGDIVVKGSGSNGLTRRQPGSSALGGRAVRETTVESRRSSRGRNAARKVQQVAKAVDRATTQRMREELNPGVIQKRREKTRKAIGKAISGTVGAGRKARQFTDDVVNTAKYLRDLNRRGKRRDSAPRNVSISPRGEFLFKGTTSIYR